MNHRFQWIIRQQNSSEELLFSSMQKKKITIEYIKMCIIWRSSIVELPEEEEKKNLRHTTKRYLKKKKRQTSQEEIKYFHLIYVLKVTQFHTLSVLYPIKFKWNQITIFVCALEFFVCFMHCCYGVGSAMSYLYFVDFDEVKRWRGEIAITENNTHTKLDGMKNDIYTYTSDQKYSFPAFENHSYFNTHKMLSMAEQRIWGNGRFAFGCSQPF